MYIIVYINVLYFVKLLLASYLEVSIPTYICHVVYCVQNLRSGTTAVVGMVTDSHLHMGWTGDSQIVLVRRGVPSFTSQPHKPEREVQCERDIVILVTLYIICTHRGGRTRLNVFS